MISFYLPVLSFVLSVVAISPIIYSLIKKHISKLTLDIYVKEIGFTRFGPQVGIMGNFRAHRSNLYVQNLSLEIEHSGTKDIIRTKMFLFRLPNFSFNHALSEISQTSLEIATGFTVPEHLEIKRDILFVAEPKMDPLEGNAERINELFGNYQKKYEQRNRVKHSHTDLEKFNDKNYITGFLAEPETKAASHKLLQKFWWREGMYVCKIVAVTSLPTKHFRYFFEFELDKTDIDTLKGNTASIISEYCLNKSIAYTFRYK